jgi:gluconate 2-dehydrogenase gamma chain
LEQHVRKPSRRSFLAGAVLSGAACRHEEGARLTLAGEEARTLDAICDQLIPADQDPGAAAAGVVVFIDRQLAGPYGRYRRAYREGLARADTLSRKMFGRALHQLPGEQRLAVVTRIEEEVRPFFEMVLAHTMQGFYGSPRHGGNRDYASWRMLRVPASPVRGRIRYDLRQGEES